MINDEGGQSEPEQPPTPADVIVRSGTVPNYSSETEPAEPKAGSASNPIHIRDPDLGDWTARLVYWTRALVAATIVSAAVAALQWWELQKAGAQTDSSIAQLKRQADAIDGQLDEMKSQRLLTVTQLRANLRREHPDLHPIGEGGKPIGIGETLLGWEVNPWWTNTGSTDAINTVSWWKLSVMPFPPAVQGRVNLDCAMPPRPSEKIAPSIVQRENKLIELAQILSTDDAIKASGPNPTEIIELAGHIEYNDVFPGTTLHHFDWCVIAIPHDIQRSDFSFLRSREEVDR